ncbi:MAG: hypothetical protein ACOCRN_03700, partial [Spirochaetia bacterium]
MSSESHTPQLFERNLDAVRSLNPRLAERIRAAEIPAECEIVAADDTITDTAAPPVMRLGGNLVHSTRNPRREAARLVDAAVSGPASPRLILFEGFGLGYHIEHALEIAPDTHCVVIETDPGLVKAAFHCRDFRAALANDHLSILIDTGTHALTPILRTIRRHELAIARLRTVYTRHRTYYEAIDRAVENLLRRQEINHNTLVRFGRRWVRNLADNLHVIAGALPVSRLE